MKLVNFTIVFALALTVSAKAADDMQTLAGRAARAEMAFYVFQTNRDAHAAKFMKAWVDACQLAGNETTSDMRRSFIKAYVKDLQTEPGAAAQKPLQTYIRKTFWKSGTGCETIETETPGWALK